MLRTALLLAWLISVIVCRPATVTAQTDRSHGRGSDSPTAAPRSTSSTAPPGLFKLAQNGPNNLVDQLRMLRGKMAGRQSRSSRRTAQSQSTGRAAPATPAPSASEIGQKPDAAPTTSGTAGNQRAGELPSVLVRKPSADEKAPIAKPEDMVEAPLGESRTSSETIDNQRAGPPQSSRRTARRWRSPRTTSAPEQPDAAAETSGREAATGGKANLSLSQQGPRLRVEAVGPQMVAVGKTARYRVRLLNQGEIIARDVVVAVTLPASVKVHSTQSELGRVDQSLDETGRRKLTWSMEQVSANARQELALNLEATQNQPLDIKVDWTYRPSPLTARVAVQQPQLELSLDGPSEMRFGDTEVFKVRLSNPGNGPAENVTVNVTTTSPNEQLNRIGTLAAGESRAVELEVTAKEAGKLRIDAMARADGPLQVKSSHEIKVRQAVLAIDVSAPELLYAGTTAAYTIKVANRGDAVAENVIMQVDLPTGATNGIGVDKKPIDKKQPRWRVGNLSPDVERVYSMECDLNANGRNQLVARVQGPRDAGPSDTAETLVEAIADLKLIVNDPKGPVPVGQDAVYEIQVLNRGSKQATNVGLVAQFSDGIEAESINGHPAEIVPGQVLFEPLESIPAGEKVTVQITARAAQDGNLQFRAELTCETPETNLVAQENTRFYGDVASRSARRPTNQPTPAYR